MAHTVIRHTTLKETNIQQKSTKMHREGNNSGLSGV